MSPDDVGSDNYEYYPYEDALRHRQKQRQKQQDHQRDSSQETQLWWFRWCVLIFFVLGFLAAIAAIIVTRNPLMAGIPGGLLLAMRPIVRWLFPQRQVVATDKSIEDWAMFCSEPPPVHIALREEYTWPCQVDPERGGGRKIPLKYKDGSESENDM